MRNIASSQQPRSQLRKWPTTLLLMRLQRLLGITLSRRPLGSDIDILGTMQMLSGRTDSRGEGAGARDPQACFL